MTLIPTILCGGSGSRLWPVSREEHPKPFIHLSDGQSLLQKTFLRACQLTDVTEVLTITNKNFFFKTQDEIHAVNSQSVNTSFIVEPFGRNTAPAIATAALYIAAQQNTDAVILILPADHIVAQQDKFEKAVGQAIELAEQGKLVTFGIHPESPETGYGYIHFEGNHVLNFIEKPSLEKAKQYIAEKNYLWNSGMFCFSINTLLNEMEKHCQDILMTTKICFDKSSKNKHAHFISLDLSPEHFDLIPNISIDYALIEKSTHLAVVPCNIGWNDIGTWDTLSRLNEPDENQNFSEGETLLHDVSNCYFRNHDRFVGAIGVKDLFVIDTPDALLIVDKSRAQDVKHLFAELKTHGHQTYKIHRMVHRPWGAYTVLEEGARFKIKRIEVKPGASLSLQIHHHRSEHWVVVSGMAKVINGDKTMLINTNESTYIAAGQQHRLENPGVIPLVVIEVQSGEYMGEDDIIRFNDIYGRT